MKAIHRGYPCRRFDDLADATFWRHGVGAFKWDRDTLVIVLPGARHGSQSVPTVANDGLEIARLDTATWEWNGDRNRPTLHPSIHTEYWHGLLRAGVLEQL